ncbi:unnamed protein product, partial [Colletotrichum noveboracense]
LLLATALDSMLLVAVIVVACTLGKPLSYLNCAALPSSGSTATFMTSVIANSGASSTLNYFIWVAPTSAPATPSRPSGASPSRCACSSPSPPSPPSASGAASRSSPPRRTLRTEGAAVRGAAATMPPLRLSTSPPPPVREVRGGGGRAATALGTAALGKKTRGVYDDYSSSSDSDSEHQGEFVKPLGSFAQRPSFPPPPTAPVRKVKIVEGRVAVQPLPVLPETVSPVAAAASPKERGFRGLLSPVSTKDKGGLGLLSPVSPKDKGVSLSPTTPKSPLERVKSKRRTIMHFIDGWWDLGLLEQERKKSLMRAASRKA